MSLTGKIMSLFADKEKSIPIFPRTKVKAISDDNGVGLDAILDGMSSEFNNAMDRLSEVEIEYTATISPTWTGNAAPYTQEILVAGILENDDPITDLVVSDDYTTAQLQLEEWAKIYRIETGDGKIIVYANEPTTVSLPIQLVVSRDKVMDTEVIDGAVLMDGSVPLSKLVSDIGVDMIIEHGTSGIWTYRKWSSGIAECWGIENIASVSVATAYGSVYHSGRRSSPSLPFTIYDSVVSVNIFSQGTDFAGSVGLTDNNTISYYLVNPTSYTVSSGKVQYNIIGKWK